MSKKPSAQPRACLRTIGRLSAFSSLIIGSASVVLAQPASSTWNTTISFSGSGNLDMSNFGTPGNTDSDPLIVSMTGAGVNTANVTTGGFNTTSAMNAFATVNLPADGTTVAAVNDPITQPKVGVDPGLNLKAPGSFLTGNASPPFYGLFPPAAGTVYTGTVSKGLTYLFGFDGSAGDGSYTVNFNGPATLTLVDAPIVTQNGTDYTFAYDNSILELNANVGGNDPTVDFTGELDITVSAGSATAATPDTGAGLVGSLVMLGVCVVGVQQRSRLA